MNAETQAAAASARDSSGRRVDRGPLALLVALTLWAVGPLVAMIVHSVSAGVALTGADGPVSADVLQYLAWVRDAGSHGLAANLFDLGPQTHVWLHPMFTLSGAAVALGAGVIAAYLAWTPVAIGALFAGAWLWVRELVGPGAARVAALALALFLNNPLRAIVDANTAPPGHFDSQLVQATSEPFSAGLLWGYLPTVLAIALMPLCLVAAARAVRRGVTAGRGALAAAALAAALATWLHPWQGVVLVAILAGTWAWRRRRDELTLLAPAIAGALPLVYYGVLGQHDAAWRLSRHVTTQFPHFSAAVLFVALGPLVLLAAVGLARTFDSPLERALALWVPAAIVAYFVVPYPSHALEGISLPLAILIVRGWRRVSAAVPLGRTAPAVAALAVAAVTLPGMAVDARDFRNLAHNAPAYFYLRSDERRALDWVASNAPAGGVVAPLPLATSIPAHTGRAVWVGHAYWSPAFDFRAAVVGALFDGRLNARLAAAAVALVKHDGASVLVSDCAHRTDLAPLLGAAVRAVERFGCASVYVLR